MQIQVTITDQATPRVHALLAQLAPEGRRAALGGAAAGVVRLLRRHFAARDAEGNRRDWPRTHWWTREVRSATAVAEVTADEATVRIASRQFALAVTGGTIRPLAPRRFLALPLRAEVAGKYPRSRPVEGLFFLRSRSGRGGFLATREEGAGVRGRLTLWYRLVASVRRPADPRALPPEGEIAAQAGARLRGAVERAWAAGKVGV